MREKYQRKEGVKVNEGVLVSAENRVVLTVSYD